LHTTQSTAARGCVLGGEGRASHLMHSCAHPPLEQPPICSPPRPPHHAWRRGDPAPPLCTSKHVRRACLRRTSEPPYCARQTRPPCRAPALAQLPLRSLPLTTPPPPTANVCKRTHAHKGDRGPAPPSQAPPSLDLMETQGSGACCGTSSALSSSSTTGSSSAAMSTLSRRTHESNSASPSAA